MSHARMFSLKPRDSWERKYANAWGGAFRIWQALATHHLHATAGEMLVQIADGDDRLWRLYEDDSLPLRDRVVLVLTFDHAYVEARDVPKVARFLREFDTQYPVPPGNANHLPTWADDMERVVEEGVVGAIAFHHTSVSSDPWVEWPEPCHHEPDPEPIVLGPEDGMSIAEYLPEIRDTGGRNS